MKAIMQEHDVNFGLDEMKKYLSRGVEFMMSLIFCIHLECILLDRFFKFHLYKENRSIFWEEGIEYFVASVPDLIKS